MGTCLTKGFNFHSEKLWEIDVSDITTFLLNLNIGKQSALSKLSLRYPYPPKKTPRICTNPMGPPGRGWGGDPDPWTPWPATPLTARISYSRLQRYCNGLQLRQFCVATAYDVTAIQSKTVVSAHYKLAAQLRLQIRLLCVVLPML